MTIPPTGLLVLNLLPKNPCYSLLLDLVFEPFRPSQPFNFDERRLSQGQGTPFLFLVLCVGNPHGYFRT